VVARDGVLVVVEEEDGNQRIKRGRSTRLASFLHSPAVLQAMMMLSRLSSALPRGQARLVMRVAHHGAMS
jgi:hypothetical protein